MSMVIEIIDDNTYELNIQPQASILNVFSRLSYKPWYAIAEFVDNSTQSYLNNELTLREDPDFNNLIVKVNYDFNNNTLTIVDNAFGMEIEKFKDAILLDSRNNEQNGRNEFGMGLKTAASWFGNVWSVTSTQLMSSNQYTATVDIPRLKDSNNNLIEILRSTVDVNSHGTTIIISDVTKKITGTRTIGKIKDLLASMYRRDINNKNIEVFFNDEKISFQHYPILNFRGKQWKKTLDFYVEFDNKKYHVTGFVAIMESGSFLKAGFALFRQDRVVIGGTDQNYKPTQIFGQSQSPIAHKLFGELDMNDFPVNQAKDGFVWDDGLEEAFVNELKNNIQEYIAISNLTIKERAKETEFSKEVSEKIQNDVEKVLGEMANDKVEELKKMDKLHETTSVYNNGDLEDYKQTFLSPNEEDKIVGTKRSYIIPINLINNKKVNVNWQIGKDDLWIDYTELENEIEVIINIDHPFFKPYSKDEQFKVVLEKFVLAFVIAEQQAKAASDKEGYILSSTIKNRMNYYLSRMVGE